MHGVLGRRQASPELNSIELFTVKCFMQTGAYNACCGWISQAAINKKYFLIVSTEFSKKKLASKNHTIV